MSQEFLNKLLSTEAGANSRQPLQEAEATLAEQLSTIRQLFQPNPPDAHEQIWVQQLPPDTWPRGQQLQPLQQHQLLLQTPPAGIAPPHSATSEGASTASEGANNKAQHCNNNKQQQQFA